MSWALRPVSGVEELPAFEEGIAAVLAGSSGAVLCQYDREKFNPVTLASVAGFHTRSVAAATYYADPLLRICRQYAPPGIRIAGELDYQAAEPLGLALAETVRLGGDITVNMTVMTFVDARCSLMVADAARTVAAASHPGEGCGACPRSRPGSPGSEWPDVPGITVVTGMTADPARRRRPRRPRRARRAAASEQRLRRRVAVRAARRGPRRMRPRRG